jgi:hypothetical protein
MMPAMTLEEAALQLEEMQNDPNFITHSAYSPTAVDYADHMLPFVQVHLAYLRKHHQVDPAGYLSNMKIMMKRR